jgi:hypothetical protein
MAVIVAEQMIQISVVLSPADDVPVLIVAVFQPSDLSARFVDDAFEDTLTPL